VLLLRESLRQNAAGRKAVMKGPGDNPGRGSQAESRTTSAERFDRRLFAGRQFSDQIIHQTIDQKTMQSRNPAAQIHPR
jgi:hypothetical protein